MQLTMSKKLSLGFGSMLLVLTAMGGSAYSAIGQLEELSDKVVLALTRKDIASQLEAAVGKQTTGIRGFLLAGREDLLKIDEEGKQEFESNMEAMQKLISTDEGRRLYGDIRHSYDEFRGIADREVQLQREGKSKEAVDLAFSPESSAVRTRLRQAMGEINALNTKLKDETLVEQGAAESHARSLVWMLAVIGLAIGLSVTAFITRSMKSSVAEMLGLIQEVARGNLTVDDMEVTSQDEIGEAGLALNEMKNSLQRVIQGIADTAQRVSAASHQLSTSSQQISANSEETSAQANVVSEATQQVSQNLKSVSTGAAEMTSTIQSIAANAHEAATVASSAMQTAQAANSTVGKLGASSAEIGEVIKVITSIAQQTNLLALNATIEAARAGEAGKGFAVVANEVKELAKQTAKATEDISRKITAIQTDTKGAVDAIGSITGVISQVNDISGTIATAVEEQSATTTEMTRNVGDAAKGSEEITRNIEGVAEAARGTSSRAQDSQKAANELSEMAVQLDGLVSQFKIEGAARGNLPAQSGHKTMAARAGR